MSNGPRVGSVRRDTNETAIEARVNLDGSGEGQIHTGIGFLDHMIEQVARHSLIDITLNVIRGDLHIDTHHTVEDAAITLGQAMTQALGNRAGIVRMADATVAMDEALAMVVLDLSGRPYVVLDIPFQGERLGELPTEMIEHFLWSLAQHGGITLHVRLLAGRNDHHRAEAIFKGLARALGAAVRIDPRREGSIPSTKGTLA